MKIEMPHVNPWIPRYLLSCSTIWINSTHKFKWMVNHHWQSNPSSHQIKTVISSFQNPSTRIRSNLLIVRINRPHSVYHKIATAWTDQPDFLVCSHWSVGLSGHSDNQPLPIYHSLTMNMGYWLRLVFTAEHFDSVLCPTIHPIRNNLMGNRHLSILVLGVSFSVVVEGLLWVNKIIRRLFSG